MFMNNPEPGSNSPGNKRMSLLYKSAIIIKKLAVPALVIIIHVILIFTITISTGEIQKKGDTTIFKMVDVEEYLPPPEPEKEKKKETKKEDVIEVPSQPDIAETVIQTEREIVETKKEQGHDEIEYLPQHKISVAPVFPTEQILSQIRYPVIANKQKIEGVVYLELYIDKNGIIRHMRVLKDPGYGFAQAAIEALGGIRCEPAKANGEPVAVRFRYPIRFRLK
jgi:protein TonB